MKKTARRILKYTVILALSSVIIITSGAAVFVYFYPEEKVLEIIREQSSEILNRPVKVGSIEYTFRGIVLSDIAVSERGATENQKPIVSTEKAIITFSLFSLLGDEIDIWSIYLKGVKIDWKFRENWNSNLQELTDELASADKTSEAGSSDRKINLSRIVLEKCSLRLSGLPQRMKPLEGQYIADSTINIHDNSTYYLTDTKLFLPHRRGTLFPELKIDFKNDFKAEGKVKAEQCSLGWTYRFARTPISLPFDTVNAEIDKFELTSAGVNGHATGTTSFNNSEKKAVVDGWCYVDFSTLAIAISDLKGQIGSTTLNLNNLVIDADKEVLKKFKASNVSAELHDLRILLDFLPGGLYGKVRGDLSYNGKYYNGSLKLLNCGLRTDTDLISGLSTEIDIKNNSLKKEKIPLKFLGSSCTVSIATLDRSFQTIYASLQSPAIDLNNFIPRSSSGEKKAISSVRFPVAVSGKIQAGKIIYGDYTLQNTTVDYRASGKTVRINRAATSVLSGTVSGAGQINLAQNPPKANTSIQFRNIKLHEINFDDKNMKNRFFGLASGSANLSMDLSSNIGESLRGRTVFNITRGKVVNTGVQKGLIFFLADLRYKLKDLEFNRIYGNIDINGKKLRSNSFIFNSEDVRLSLTGDINTDLIADNMIMKLEFNNHFIKDIPRPAVAVLNKYSSGRWYVIPFIIRGNITDSKNIKIAGNK